MLTAWISQISCEDLGYNYRTLFHPTMKEPQQSTLTLHYQPSLLIKQTSTKAIITQILDIWSLSSRCPLDHQGPPQITGSWLTTLTEPFDTSVTGTAHPFWLMKSLTWILDNFDNLKQHPIPKVIGPLLGILLLLPPPSIRQSAPIWKQQRQRKCSTQNKDKESVQLGRPSPICKPAACHLAQEAICCYCNFCHYSFYCRPTFCWIATFAITFSTYSALFTYSIANCRLFVGLPARARRVQVPWAVRRPFRRQPAVIGHILHCRLWPVWRPKNQTKFKLVCNTRSQSQSWSSFTNSSEWKHFGQISQSLPSFII